MGTYPTGVLYRGLNRAGAEYGDDWDGWTGQTFYTFPTAVDLASELAFYGDKGFNAIRLPISWERLQHSLNGPLDPGYTNQVLGFANQAAAAGLAGYHRSAQLQPIRNRRFRCGWCPGRYVHATRLWGWLSGRVTFDRCLDQNSHVVPGKPRYRV
jgi:hypothetical protein